MNATKRAPLSEKPDIEKDRYKVRQGEPGRNIVTPLRDGDPVIENPPVALASPPSPLPSVIEDQTESKPVALSPQKEIAHYRYDLIAAIEAAISSQKQLKKGTVIDQCLKAYNSGIFLQDIHKKLKHVKRSLFYEWRRAFQEGGIEALASQKGRKGESKIADDEKNNLIGILYSPDSKNHVERIGTAIRLMKYALQLRGIPSPSSERTLRRFAAQFEKEHSDLVAIRHGGEKELNDRILPYISRDRNLLEVGDCLVGDGHRLNFQIINPFTGKPCRPAIVVFLDWRSNFPCGWEIMLEENVQCVASALRNAILALGKIPKCVYLDNGKAFKAKVFNSPLNFDEAGIRGMFLRLGIQTIFSQSYNAQAKPIERWFRTFTDWFERLMPSFTGSSIGDKPAYMKRNEKLALSMHDPWIPTIPEVNDLLPQWREFYMDQPSRGLSGKTPREIFEPGKGSGVDPGELAYLMMPMEIKNITRNGIDLFGCHWYDEALYGLRDRVLVKYSLCDLSQIYCFYKNEFLCTLKPRPKAHPLAFKLGTPKDVEDVKRMIAQKRSLKNQTVKLYKLLGKKQQDQLPWKEINKEVPDMEETIDRINAEKHRPPTISPFIDGIDDRSEPGAFSPDEQNLIETKRQKNKIVSPFTDEAIQQEPAAKDVCEEPPIVDQRTGLSRPSDGTIFKNEFEYYEWYRSIEEKFPGILNDTDWKKIENYQASLEWEDFYGRRGYARMVRTASDPGNTSLDLSNEEAKDEGDICCHKKHEEVPTGCTTD